MLCELRNASVFVETVCGGYMHQSRGVLQSPNHPNNYPDNSNCTWTVAVTTGRTVDAQFTALSIRGSAGSCDSDYVEVGYII